MPRKPKSSAKSTPKPSDSYPNPLPLSLQSHPPIPISNNQTSSDASYDTQLAEWTAKNARAKAIIMSTLVPGSEPWQIAEPLEYAADIWKALEEKYGPNSEKKGFDAKDVVHDEDDDGQATDGGWQEKLPGDPPAAPKDSLAQEVSEGLQEVAELWTHEREQEQAQARTRCAAEGTQSAEEKRKWNDDSMRDQRFLWALLNGGKEEELIRTYETKNHG
ncbi:hypothetical protein EPUS_02344 [Endocarpon pusillum Z07020]|uniref:Uncharacterized protein n=1 Tax=Endocarpon pusillum (strain Z07020 / HMAS-L-300199) TaxID=1263415 RepID=U1G0S7_ENDPU|nr:uncharacterized protein EPUS_02344 [Endocarpon pusillum Z07020]ERF70822.1 hypothetical protein EPUS_02344 [Endocarpon pusillum Z07020]